jgi:hypothetical protein
MYEMLQKGTPMHFSCGEAPILNLPEAALPLDPYFLGYWLGNGTMGKSELTCHMDDAREIASLIRSLGYRAKVMRYSEGNTGRISVTGLKRWDANGPRVSLGRMGLHDRKFVPPEYLRASADQRLSLLQGLMDSDGYASSREGDGSVFHNTNLDLIHAVAELVRSLGGQPRVRLAWRAGEKGGRSIVAKQDGYGVQFMLDPPVHRLSRKRKNQILKKTSRTSGHFIESITPAGTADTVCIEVDSPSHLFLVGEGMAPTHNSLLRNCYRAWFFKRRIEEVEGIGIERDLCGIPVLYASAETVAALGNGNPDVGMTRAKQLVTNIRVDDQAGVILPLSFDENKNPMVKLELLRAAGPKQNKADQTIRRYNEDILNTMLAGFIQFGQTQRGSRSMHMSATQIYSLAISAFMDSVASVVNRIALPRLMALNDMDMDYAPKLTAGEVGVRDLQELGAYVGQLAQSGLTFFDKPTSDYLRKTGGLPATPDEEIGPPPGMIPDPMARYEQGAPGAGARPGAMPPGANPNARYEQSGGRPAPESHDLDTPPEPGQRVPDARPAASNQEGRQRLRGV